MNLQKLFGYWYWILTIGICVGITWPALQWLVVQQLVPATTKIVDGGTHPLAIVTVTWAVIMVASGATTHTLGPAWLARGELLWMGTHSGHDIGARVERRSRTAQTAAVTTASLASLGWAAALPMPFGYQFALAVGSGLSALVAVRVVALAQRFDTKAPVWKWLCVATGVCVFSLYSMVALALLTAAGHLTTSTASAITMVGAVVLSLGQCAVFGWMVRRITTDSVFDRPGEIPPQWELLSAHNNLNRLVTTVQALDITLARTERTKPAGKKLATTTARASGQPSPPRRSFGCGVGWLAWRPLLSATGATTAVLAALLPGVVWFLWGLPAGFVVLLVVLSWQLRIGWRLWGSWLAGKPTQRLFSTHRKVVTAWIISPAIVTLSILVGWAVFMPTLDIAGVIVVAALVVGAWYRGFLAATGQIAANYEVAATPAGAVPLGVITKCLAGFDVLIFGSWLMLVPLRDDHLRLVSASLIVALALAVWLSRAFSRSSQPVT